MKDDQKNFILFALFAALMLFGWPFVTSKIFPAANPPVTKIVGGKTEGLPTPANAATGSD